MKDLKYPLPTRLNRENIELFYSLSNNTHPESGDQAIFDFNNCRFVSPTGAAALLIYRDWLKENDVETRALIRSNSKLYKILSVFGLPLEANLEDAYTSRMQDMSVPIRRCYSYDECLDVQDAVMNKIVSRTRCKKGTEAAIDYMLNEIWDNAGVHGYQCYDTTEYPLPIYIGAFSYKNEVEVVIADRGQGIHSSLQKMPKYRNLSAKQALERALDNEVSGHPDNSPGFGLYSTAQFLLRGQGTLAIWSSGRQLRLSSNGKMKTHGSKRSRDEGTLISFSVKTGIEIPFESVIGSQDAEEYLELIKGF